MLASELPFEILLQVADFVLTEDKFSCTLTCKKWKNPFQESLWKNVEIDSMETLENMCTIVNQPSAESPPYGLIVQGLRFTGKSSLTNWQLNPVFRTFLNLKHLDIETISFGQVDLKQTIHGAKWESLTSIKLRIEPSEWTIPTTAIIQVLTNIPNLQKIDISFEYLSYTIDFELQQFNELHKALPHLVAIKTNLNLCDINPNEASDISNTIPAVCVETLDLTLFHWRHLWLYYFTLKYPNLRTLRWKASPASRELIDEDYGSARIAPFRSITKAFVHLETIYFCTEETTEWAHAIFWELLCRSNVSIKNLNYQIKDCSCGALFLESIIRKFVQSFSRTLETFTVVGDVFFNIENIARPEFSYCPLLVDIEFKDCGVSIALDNLLDNCTTLIRFRFSNGQLYLCPDAQIDRKAHGLRILELDSIFASAPVFNYTSIRCNNLQYMNLTQSYICGPISDKTGRLCIDMPHTQFKVLHLNRVQFYSSVETIDENTAINLILLSQLTKPLPSMENTEEVSDSLSVDTIGWFHLFCELDYAFDYAPKIRQLSKQEADDTIKYYQEFRSIENIDVPEVERSFNGQVSKENWKADLCRGYSELRCGHIADYRVPLFWTDEKDFWQMLYSNLPKM